MNPSLAGSWMAAVEWREHPLDRMTSIERIAYTTPTPECRFAFESRSGVRSVA
jgi:hypothetical protein